MKYVVFAMAGFVIYLVLSNKLHDYITLATTANVQG